jgi:hypothetical protein
MSTRYFVLIVGIAFLLAGLAGFVGPLVQPPAAGEPVPALSAGYGYLLGIFPVNVLHNIVHLAVGALGIWGYRNYPSARLYARGLAIFYGLLTVMGIIPGLNTTFGLIPIFGNDIWLHAATAILAAYFGFIAQPSVMPDTTIGTTSNYTNPRG